jgi:hypothetical protein
MNITRIKPCATVVVATIALVVGLEAPAMGHQVASAAHKISGTTIKKHTIAGNRLKNNTVTGAQVKESTLGTVPKAAVAGEAQSLPPLPAITPITTFEHGWSDYAVIDDPAGYYKDAEGLIHLTGAIHGGTVGGAAFTLPTGYQGFGFFASGSTNTSFVAAPCTVAVGEGEVVIATGCDNFEVGLDGIAFRPTG